MHPPGARRLDRHRKPAVVGQLYDGFRQAHDLREVDIITRIEIDDAAIGVIDVRDPRQPRMHFNGAQLHGVQQRREISADESRLGAHRLRPDSGRYMLAGILLKEERSPDPIWKALQYQRPVSHVRLQHRPHVGVVAHQPALRDTGVREEDLPQTRHVKRASRAEVQIALAAVSLDCIQLRLHIARTPQRSTGALLFPAGGRRTPRHERRYRS